ncbi:glutathione S-transferase family protein [Rhizobium sp. BK376]|jgi:glutathione S-transferase|uniref:glutathione S-transferase family protein n=1 Tax=Rhizobium sp. BK376 TaxID=2512149 RepID=UPI00104BB34A|nr:glutathione S-transferase family protein [Rhizobium sp. BK376]TCR83931.1 glutathione S-transferase [Rhizobium sp. BK376]
MTLVLYHHPLASFCHKVLIALYESGTPFEHRIVDLGNEVSRNELIRFWALGKIPLLRDEARDKTVPETSIIIEYIDRHYPGPQRLLPEEIDQALQVRLWDRFFDLYVQLPMQKIVADHMRPEGSKDPAGVTDSERNLQAAYDMIEAQLTGPWITGDAFTMADCSAAPALFYAVTLVAFGTERPKLNAYYERLLARPSFARVLQEAIPYFKFYPFHDRLAPEFRSGSPAA